MANADHDPASTFDPVAALGQLGAIWSDNFDAYASGQLDISKVHCALCQCAPCRCPEFGTDAYFALIDQRHGRASRRTAVADPESYDRSGAYDALGGTVSDAEGGL